MTFDEFDNSTPRMVQRFIDGYSEQIEERQRELTIAAFHGVGFYNTLHGDGGLTAEHLRLALYGDDPKGRDYDAEFERRSSSMATFFGRIKAAQEHP